MGPIKRIGNHEEIRLWERQAKRQNTRVADVALPSLKELGIADLLPKRNISQPTEVLNANDVIAEKRSGHLSVRFSDGQLFEGDFISGIAHGKGIQFRQNGSVLFSGSLSRGKIYGRGEQFWPNGNLLYKGYFVDNVYQGYGELYSESGERLYNGYWHKGMRYSGETKDGKPNGRGILRHANGDLYYEGSFKDGEPHGYGECEGYKGQYRNGLKEGRGVQFYPTTQNKWYEGGWRKDKCYGKGSLYYEDGKLAFIGNFVDGKMHGPGTKYRRPGGIIEGYWYFGNRYEGEFFHGCPHWEGKMFDVDEVLIYEGGFNRGWYEGHGKYYCKGILVYEGGFKDGKFHGCGTNFGFNGVILLKGAWFEGAFLG